MSRGAEFYRQQRYIDADQLFAHTEAELSGYAPRERAEYALYRGATLLALGEHAAARRWLGHCAELERTGRLALTPGQRALLLRSVVTLPREGIPDGESGAPFEAATRAPPVD